MLDALPDNLRRAYRYGDWNALSGTYFSEFDRRVHVTAPHAFPAGVNRFRAFDYGLDMLACLWFAVGSDGGVTVYRELRAKGLIVSDAAKAILAASPPDEEIAATLAPPDMQSRQKDTGMTMAHLFAQGGVPLSRASSDRVYGHMSIHELLRRGETAEPGLKIFSSCPGLISDLESIMPSEINPNDCAVSPHEVTHAVDALRYFAASKERIVPQAGISAPKSDGYSRFMSGKWGNLR